MVRRPLLAVACLLAVAAAAMVATAGFATTIGGVRVSARSPSAAAIAAVLAALAWLVAASRARRVHGDLVAADAWLERRADAAVATIAGLAGAFAISYQTFSAAGADASGYLSQAAMLASGALTYIEPLGAIADWPGAASTFLPLGWWMTADVSTQVPTYPIGLPLLMVPLHVAGGALFASLIGPASLALTVWAGARLAHRVAGASAALLAAVWIATSPVALIAAMQPMADMPATAAWLVCWVAVLALDSDEGRRKNTLGVAAGLAAGVAVVIRPNLAPAVAVPAALLLLRHRRLLPAFAMPVALAAVIVGYVQWRWFGSPLRSGYGTAGQIYAMSNMVPNAGLYTEWLLDTHGPWLLAAPLAAIAVPSRSLRWLLVFAAAIVVAYLVYAVFEVWTYLRFVLPALAIAMVAVSTLIVHVSSRWPAARFAVVFLAILAVASLQIRSARTHDVFSLASRHARALLAGRYLEAATPERSLIIAGEQSGSLRYYTGRSIVRWELTSPETLEIAVARAQAAGYDVWVALDEFEEDLVRQKYGTRVIGLLDWPPQLESGTLVRTRAWRIRDRAAFHRTGIAHTDRLR